MFDTTVHLGDVAVTSILTVLGYGLRRSYNLAVKYIHLQTQRMKDVDDLLESHAVVIDLHSNALRRAGLHRGLGNMEKLSERRRSTDREEEYR